MRLELIQGPVDPVVTLAEAKAYLRVDDHAAHDALITSLIAAATARLDGRDGVLGRALSPQAWRAILPGFPCGAIELPLPPTNSVESLIYLDTSGIEREIDQEDYRLIDGGSGGARIVPAEGTRWPATAAALDAVRITFECGYDLVGSPPVSGVPEPLRQAILMTVGDWYDTSGSAVIGQTVAYIPITAERLAAPFRVIPVA